MGYRVWVVYLGLVYVCLWYRHQGSVPWRDHPTLLLRDLVFCGGAIVRIWLSSFVWWVDWPILIPFFASNVSENNFYVRGIWEWYLKIFMTSKFEGCLNVGLCLHIVAGYLFLPQHIKNYRDVWVCVPSLEPFPQRVYRRCPFAAASLVGELVQVLYHIQSYAVERSMVGCCVSSLL